MIIIKTHTYTYTYMYTFVVLYSIPTINLALRDCTFHDTRVSAGPVGLRTRTSGTGAKLHFRSSPAVCGLRGCRNVAARAADRTISRTSCRWW